MITRWLIASLAVLSLYVPPYAQAGKKTKPSWEQPIFCPPITREVEESSKEACVEETETAFVPDDCRPYANGVRAMLHPELIAKSGRIANITNNTFVMKIYDGLLGFYEAHHHPTLYSWEYLYGMPFINGKTDYQSMLIIDVAYNRLSGTTISRGVNVACNDETRTGKKDIAFLIIQEIHRQVYQLCADIINVAEANVD